MILLLTQKKTTAFFMLKKAKRYFASSDTSEKNWLYFIESVTMVGPMDSKRFKEIEEMAEGVKAGKVYVTAFLDFKTFKKFLEALGWGIEVWIADIPNHMIHLNGDKFLGPRT